MSETYHFHGASAQLAVPEKAVFREGGVYRAVNGCVYKLSPMREQAAGLYDGHPVGWAKDLQGRFGYGYRSLIDGHDMDPSGLPADAGCRDLIPGELLEVNGKWVPLGPRLKFPSGATLHTDGGKIVGRTEAEAPKSQIKRLTVHAEPKRDPLRWNTKTRFDPFKDFLVGSGSNNALPGATHPLQRMTDTSLPAHGSAHLLPKG